MEKRRITLSLVMLICLATALSFVSATGAWTQDLSENLVGYWNFDDNTSSSNVINQFDPDYNGTLTNSLNNYTSDSYYSSGVNGSILFNGVDNYVTVPYFDGLNFTKSGGGCFVFTTNVKAGTSGHLMSRYGDSGFRSFSATRSSSNLDIYTTATESTRAVAGLVPNANHVFVACYDGTNTTIYKDGVFDVSKEGNLSDHNGVLRFGANSRATVSQWYNGSIDEAAVYNRTLTLEEVIDLNSSITYSPVCIIPDVDNSFVAQFNNKCHFDSDVDLGTGSIIISGSSDTFKINSNVTAHNKSLTCSAAGCQEILSVGSSVILT